MWELCKKLPHGRISVRRISLLASLLVLAIFAQLTVFSTPVLAADVSRTGNTASYGGNTYSLATTSDIPSGLPAGTTGYLFKDVTAGSVSFILTSGDPAKATTGQYVVYPLSPDGSLGGAPRAPPTAVSIADAPPSSLTNSTKGTSSCDGSLTGGAGWIICPVTNFLASRMDDIHRILTSFLEVRPVQSDPSSSLYRMWAIVRDIANICFVIVFLIIVYSQITSIGFSNYNLKRMLPRLIIGAILVNTSFWIAALGVDLSNVLGYTVYDLMMGIQRSLSGAGQYNTTVPTWQVVTTYVLSAGGAAAGLSTAVIAAGGIGAALTLLIPTILVVFLGALAAVAILAARQAIITVCIIIAPLAFVAYVLPSTEKYFEKWKDLMMTMLLMFPLFSLVFAGAQLAGLAIIQNATSILQIIIGMAVQVAPVVITPMLIKLSGSLLGKIAGIINNPNRGLIDRTRNWSKDRAALHAARVRAGQERTRVFNRNPVNRAVRSRDMARRRREGLKSAYEAQAANDFTERDNRRYHNSEQSIEAMTRRTAVRKQQIENSFGRTAVAQRLEFDKRMTEADKVDVENTFSRTHLGHSAEMRTRHVHDQKKVIEAEHENDYLVSTNGRTNQLEIRHLQDRKKVIDSQQSYEHATSQRGRSNELEIRELESRENSRKARADRHFSELNSGNATDGYYGDFATNGHLQVRGQALSASLKEVSVQVSLDNMAKRNAEFALQSDIAKTIESSTIHLNLGGMTARQYAAGVAGTQGEASALASARSTAREQFGKFSAEYEELRNQYMPPIGDVKEFLRGNQNLQFKDETGNVVLEVDGSNMYAVNAMVKHITSVGVVDEVDEMIKLSGRGQPLHDYRETVADVLAQKGYGSRSIYEGGQVIERVRQGEIASETDLLEHIQEQTAKGKVSPADLATMDAVAIGRFISSIKHDRRAGGANDAGIAVSDLGPGYLEEVAKLVESAHDALTDDRLKGSVKGNAKIQLEKLEHAYRTLPKNAQGDIDLSGLSLQQIQNLLP
jgi:hypothetical protein